MRVNFCRHARLPMKSKYYCKHGKEMQVRIKLNIDYFLIFSKYLKHSWNLSHKNIFIGLSNDPNFSIAVADGHRQFVAHKKFQQQLHRQWQEQRRSDQLLKKRMFQRYCK